MKAFHCKKPGHEEREVSAFSNVQISTQSDNKLKKQRKTAQAEEQNRSIETDSTKNKKRYMNYPTKNLSNSHKDIQ